MNYDGFTFCQVLVVGWFEVVLSIFRRLKARGLAYNLVWPFKGGVAALLVVVVEEQLAPSNFVVLTFA